MISYRAREFDFFLMLMPTADRVGSTSFLIIYVIAARTSLSVYFPSFVLPRLLSNTELICSYITEDYLLEVFFISTSYSPGPGILILHVIYLGELPIVATGDLFLGESVGE